VEEDEETMISCSASFNTLNLIMRDECLMTFVKYVSHAAPSSRYDLAAAFTTDLSEQEMEKNNQSQA
jgi:prolyl 3-hydroxylase /prolyl 3,4-dihydroxylase